MGLLPESGCSKTKSPSTQSPSPTWRLFTSVDPAEGGRVDARATQMCIRHGKGIASHGIDTTQQQAASSPSMRTVIQPRVVHSFCAREKVHTQALKQVRGNTPNQHKWRRLLTGLRVPPHDLDAWLSLRRPSNLHQV